MKIRNIICTYGYFKSVILKEGCWLLENTQNLAKFAYKFTHTFFFLDNKHIRKIRILFEWNTSKKLFKKLSLFYIYFRFKINHWWGLQSKPKRLSQVFSLMDPEADWIPCVLLLRTYIKYTKTFCWYLCNNKCCQINKILFILTIYFVRTTTKFSLHKFFSQCTLAKKNINSSRQVYLNSHLK